MHPQAQRARGSAGAGGRARGAARASRLVAELQRGAGHLRRAQLHKRVAALAVHAHAAHGVDAQRQVPREGGLRRGGPACASARGRARGRARWPCLARAGRGRRQVAAYAHNDTAGPATPLAPTQGTHGTVRTPLPFLSALQMTASAQGHRGPEAPLLPLRTRCQPRSPPQRASLTRPARCAAHQCRRWARPRAGAAQQRAAKTAC